MLSTLLVASFTEATKEVQCERVAQRHWGWIINGYIETCFLDGDSVIDNVGFELRSPRSESTIGILFEHNKRIEFLPENTNEIFPNLVGLTAMGCAVKAITKANFRNMKKLLELHLSHNRIQSISSDAFEDLVSLHFLFLSKN